MLRLIVLLGTLLPEPAPDPPRDGSISGEVTVVTRASRRRASRYPGGAAAHPLQPIPAVVYLEGATGTRAAPASGLEMAQRDTAFAPPVLVVPVGSTVSFPNRDPFFHNVFSYSSTERFDLGRYPMGEAKDVTFDEPGIVSVYCEVHEFMRSAIVVTPNPHWAVVDESGSFTLDGVPDGEHTLVLWHADLGEVRETVTVTDGAVTRVSLRLGG